MISDPGITCRQPGSRGESACRQVPCMGVPRKTARRTKSSHPSFSMHQRRISPDSPWQSSSSLEVCSSAFSSSRRQRRNAALRRMSPVPLHGKGWK